VRFDAYYSPADGFVPSGYSFTIVDPNSPAYKGSFAIAELTKESVQNKIKDVEDMRPNVQTDDAREWDTKVDTGQDTITVAKFPDHDNATISVQFSHHVTDRYNTRIVYDRNDKPHRIEAGIPFTAIVWDISAKGKHGILDRGEFGTNTELGSAAIRRIRTMLKALMRNEYRARVPAAFQFSSMLDDPGKTKNYKKFAEMIARNLGWEWAHAGEDIYLWDPEYVVDESDIPDVSESDMPEWFDDDMPADPISEAMFEKQWENFVDESEDVYTPWDIRNGLKTVSSPATLEFDAPLNTVFEDPDNGGQFDKFRFTYRDGSAIQFEGEHIHYGDWLNLYPEFSIDRPNSEFKSWLQDIKDLVMENQKKMEIAPREPDFEPDMADLMDMELMAEPKNLPPVEQHKFDNEKMEKDAIAGEKGAKDDAWYEKLWAGIQDMLQKTREFRFLKRKEFGDVQYMLRQLKKGKAGAARQAVVILKNTLKSLDKTRFHNLQRLAYLMDLYEQVQLNEELDKKGEERTVVANPYGWSDSDIKREAKKAWKLVKSDPTTEQAWLDRQNAWFEIRKAYADAMESVGFNVANRLQRVFYFRHQVLSYMQGEHKRVGLQGSPRLAVPTRRSHLKHRGAQSDYAMNLNFIQAEFEIMAQLLYDTNIAKTLDAIMSKHASEEPREGYEPYQPREGAVFYMANTIPAHLLENAMKQGGKDINIPKAQIRSALAMGGKYQGYYLPKGIADTLHTALQKKPIATWARYLFKTPLSMWKMWQLLMPLRALKYNVRNMTGDAEAVFLGSPGVFKWAPQALGEILNWKANDNISADLQEWIDRGGQETTLQAQEIFEIIERPEFKKLQADPHMSLAKKANLFRHAFNAIRVPTDVREMLLRYAAYLKFKKEITENKGKPKNYVASLREEVDALTDIRDKAFMMSNDLLGAYDRVSDIGEDLRAYVMPFWSFQEVNLKRTLTMWRNTINSDSAAINVGRKLGATSVIAALKIGKFAMKFFAFSVAVGLWNNLMFGDAEDGLPEEMRRRSHVILGHKKGENPDIYYFPRIGVVGDFLEWMGADTLPSDITDLIVGDKKYSSVRGEVKERVNIFKDIVKSYDYGAENVKDVVNKVVQAIGPQYKIIAESLTGAKFFPSVWNRQPITDYKKYVLDNFALGNIYDGLTGKPTRTDHWKREAIRVGTYYESQTRLGWLAIQQKKADYKKKAGLKGRGFIVTDSGQALYNFGLAWRYGDNNALAKYLTEYVEVTVNKLGKVDIAKTMNAQWDKLHPLDDLPEIHKKLFIASLDRRDQIALGLAFKYYAEIKSGKQFLEK
jgi:hypothetical protein